MAFVASTFAAKDFRTAKGANPIRFALTINWKNKKVRILLVRISSAKVVKHRFMLLLRESMEARLVHFKITGGIRKYERILKSFELPELLTTVHFVLCVFL